jgi:hypothetical protein
VDVSTEMIDRCPISKPDTKAWTRDAAATRPGASSVGPPTTITDAAVLLDPAEIGEGQAVIFHGMFACGLEAMLRDGCTHLIALTRCWPTLRVTLGRQQRDRGYD